MMRFQEKSLEEQSGFGVLRFAVFEMGLYSLNLTGDLDFSYMDVSADAGKIILCVCVRRKQRKKCTSKVTCVLL